MGMKIGNQETLSPFYERQNNKTLHAIYINQVFGTVSPGIDTLILQ